MKWDGGIEELLNNPYCPGMTQHTPAETPAGKPAGDQPAVHRAGEYRTTAPDGAAEQLNFCRLSR